MYYNCVHAACSNVLRSDDFEAKPCMGTSTKCTLIVCMQHVSSFPGPITVLQHTDTPAFWLMLTEPLRALDVLGT